MKIRKPPCDEFRREAVPRGLEILVEKGKSGIFCFTGRETGFVAVGCRTAFGPIQPGQTTEAV
jgi:hypothetical protein